MNTYGLDTYRSVNSPKYESFNRDSHRLYQSKNSSYGSDLHYQKLQKMTPSTQKISSIKPSYHGYISPNKLIESKYERFNKYAHENFTMGNKTLISSQKQLPKNSAVYSSQKMDTDRHRRSKEDIQNSLQRSGLTDPHSLYSSNISQQKQNHKNKHRHESKYKNYVDRMSIPTTKSINGSQILDKDFGFQQDYYSASIHNHNLTKSSYQESYRYNHLSEKAKDRNLEYKKALDKKILDDYFNKITSRLEEQKRLQYSKIDNIQTDRTHYQTGFLKKNDPMTRSRKPTKNFYDSELQKHDNNSMKVIPRIQKIDNLKYDISILSTRHPSIYTPVEKKISIKDFKLGKCLGNGRFGKVYQAIDKNTGFLVALKKISKQTIKANKLQDQFALQIKIQMYLSHPNIVKLFGIINQKDDIYLILEYLEQGSLYGYLKNRGQLLSQKQVASIIKEIVSSIKYLHDLNIVHRDIKPQNILISNKVCKLGDFGWSTLCHERRKTNCGTLDYYAPEILQGQQYDQSIDLWCVGVLTFQLLTGKVPFYHASKKETVKKIIKVQRMDFPSRVSQTARNFTQSLLVKEPTKRLNVNKLLIHPFITKHTEQKF